jgi:hypothetical protein
MTEAIELFTAGAVCPQCNRVGKVIETETRMSDGEPHPTPYRRFACACGNRWRHPIPKDEFRIVPQKPGVKSTIRLPDAQRSQK